MVTLVTLCFYFWISEAPEDADEAAALSSGKTVRCIENNGNVEIIVLTTCNFKASDIHVQPILITPVYTYM